MNNSLLLFQNDLLGHFFVNVPVTIEGLGILNVSGDFGNQIRIFQLLVEIPNQNAAGHVRAGNFPDRVLLLLSGQRIDDRYFPVYAGKPQHLLDVPIVILSASEGKEAVTLDVWVAFQDFHSCRTEGNPNRDWTSFLCLSRNVFDGAINHVALLHLEKVANPTTDKTVKDEDVSLDFESGIVRKLCCI